ncbi:MAG: NAD(P)-dependent oxidoreductase [Gammaproteobacteria bacterium]|nr:NAD(P)-dependent oxidoreductase [Gammaproteobacteria bacterium]
MLEQKTRVLVTGATGFLGSHILTALSQHSHLSPIAACRNGTRLAANFTGEVRLGDFCDADYRQSVVQNIDVICHAGTWASLWAHAAQEHEYFYQPCIDLIDQAKAAGVKRFIMASSVVMAKPTNNNLAIDDFARSHISRFWPHLDKLIAIDHYMQQQAQQGMSMISMRLGHFIGVGNRLGIVPVLLPRLNTHLVPWLANGKSHLPLIGGEDMARAFLAATMVSQQQLEPYESFNICGKEFPSSRDVFNFICEQSGAPKPHFSVPFAMGHWFAWLMETLHPLLPGKSPFLTRSIVHLAKDWLCSTEYAKQKLGFEAQQDWRQVVNEAVKHIQQQGTPWPAMVQNY